MMFIEVPWGLLENIGVEGEGFTAVVPALTPATCCVKKFSLSERVEVIEFRVRDPVLGVRAQGVRSRVYG